MTATRTPPTTIPASAPRPAGNVPARIAIGVALVAGAVALGWIGNSLVAVAVLAGVAVVVVAAGMILSRPELLLPVAVISLWFESVGAGPLSTGRIVSGLIPLVIIARAATSTWRPPALQLRAWVPIMALTIYAWCGAFWSDHVTSGWMIGFFTLLIGLAYALAFIVFTESPEQLTGVFRIWIWTGSAIAVLSDIAFFGLGYRGYGFTGGANGYAATLVCGLPVIVFLARESEGRARWLMWMNLPIFLSGIIASGSRMGLIMTACMGAYILVTLPGLGRGRRAATIVFGFIGMGVMLFVFMLLNPERFSLVALVSDRGSGRLDIWPAAIAAIKDHVLLGRGLGGFRVESYDLVQRSTGAQLTVLRQADDMRLGYIEAHNMYLTLMTDLGLLGAVLYLGVMAATFKNLWDVRHTVWRNFSWAFTGVLAVILLGSAFGSNLNFKFQWLIVGVGAGCYTKKRVERRVVPVAAD